MFALRGDGNPFGLNINLGGNFPQKFDEHFRVYSMSFCDKGHLEDGDKILLPPSALEVLARLHIEYPMLFKVTNEGVNRYSHCGVLEFSATEGSCYMPYWMMQNLFINEGDIINVQNISLPKATFVKIRPQSKEFLDISNPRAVLEASLRKFSCMTVGDTICLKYNNKNFLLDVREVKPSSAACIIETDCEVDFELPADYIHETSQDSEANVPSDSSLPYGGFPTVKADENTPNTLQKTRAFSGNGLRLKKNGSQQSTDASALRAARLQKFESFHGTGKSISNTNVKEDTMNGMKKEGIDVETSKKPASFQGQGRRLR
uniref:Ubiquitin fusion degradation protein putative n=1 Tax=Albugo laibachii Nc14 TaxID=890382 RepID=F0WAI8_9STRA|nr:ubiquitin fusion degradation protein putative [Albugo laibachii Nc14]|eukprot:CCA18159.1 ubiquitin fusion degradation protein putative [Albugo laibachii Nc14]